MEPPRPPLKPKGEFFGELEAGRGLAALLVAGFHCAQTRALVDGLPVDLKQISAPNPLWQSLQFFHDIFVYGLSEPQPHFGPLFFFVLSGFLLTDSIRRGPGAVGPASARFFLARFFRIYPAIVATLLIFWAVHAITGLALDPHGYSFSSLWRNLLLIRTNIDGVMWTVQVEVLALPMIFAAIWLLRVRWGPALVTLLFLGLVALSFWGSWERLGWGAPSRTAWLYTFLCGILAHHFGRRLFSSLSRRGTTFVFFAAVGVFFFSGLLVHQKWLILFQTIAGSTIVALLAFGPIIGAAAILRTIPLRFLGRVSYSFYLLHPLTLMIIWKQPELFGRWLDRGLPAIVLSIGLWLATTLAVLPLAWLIYRVVELPFIRLGKRVWQRSLAAG